MSRLTLSLSVGALVTMIALSANVLAQPSQSAPNPPYLPLFAVEIKVGPEWDASKPPNEQPHFREHSANLKRLRDAGALIMGARYSDIGLVVVAAETEAQARTMLSEDPSFKAGIFKYEIYPFNVFYSGTLNAQPRRPQPR